MCDAFVTMPSRVLTTRTTAAERTRLAALAVLSIVPFVALAVWAHYSPPAQWEIDLVTAVALGQNLMGDVLVAINTAGNLQNWLVIAIVATIAVALLRGRRAGLLVGAAFFVDFVATLTKLWVERGRPDTAAAHLLFGPDSYGFPSGHSARAAALAAALIWVFAPARWRLPAATVGAIIFGLVMAYARVALGVHFPIDTIGGLLLGVAWFAVTAALI